MKLSYTKGSKVKGTTAQGGALRSYNPAVTVKLYKETAVLTYSGTRLTASKSGGVRGVIKESSRRSESRFRILWEDNCDIATYWITLTYPAEFPLSGAICHAHRKEFLRRLKRIGVQDYIWRLEFQDRGAVHWNIFVDKDIDKAWLSRTWFEIVKSGDPKHLGAGTGIEPVRDKSETLSYLLSYMKKDNQKKVPDNFYGVGRFWGCTRKLQVRSEITLKFESEQDMYRWVRPLRKAYEKAITRHWKRADGKGYKIKFRRGQGFKAWSAARLFDKIIYSKEVVKNE